MAKAKASGKKFIVQKIIDEIKSFINNFDENQYRPGAKLRMETFLKRAISGIYNEAQVKMIFKKYKKNLTF